MKAGAYKGDEFSLASFEAMNNIGDQILDTQKLISEMTGKVARAQADIEFASSARAMALASAMNPYLMAGESAAAAESKARGSEEYREEMRKLYTGFKLARETVNAWDALHSQLDALRSLLASERRKIEKGL